MGILNIGQKTINDIIKRGFHMKKTAAFFDLDLTICASDSEISFSIYLFRNNIVNLRKIFKSLTMYWRYKLGIIKTFPEVSKELIKIFVKNHSVAEIHDLYSKCFEQNLLPLIYNDAYKAIEFHKYCSREIFIVSASPTFMVDLFVNKLKIDGSIATELEIKNGFYTGEVVGDICYREIKADRIRKMALLNGYELQKSYAYGNEFADIPLLSSVGIPVAVNPDKKLHSLALQKNWLIEHWKTKHKNK